MIRDPGVKIKVCDAFPEGSGSVTTVQECLQYALADLIEEKTNNSDARGVINLSLTSSGCFEWFDTLFQLCM